VDVIYEVGDELLEAALKLYDLEIVPVAVAFELLRCTELDVVAGGEWQD
jgi:hypothetical protein